MTKTQKEASVINEVIQSKIGKYSVYSKKYRVNGEDKTTPIISSQKEEKTLTIVKFLKNGQVMMTDKWNPAIEAWHKALPSIDDIEKNKHIFDSNLIQKILGASFSDDDDSVNKTVLSTTLNGKFYSSTNDILIISGLLDFNEDDCDGLFIGDFVYGCLEGEITDPSTIVTGLKLMALFHNLPKEKLNRMTGAYAEGFISESFENPYPQKYTDQYNDWFRGKDFAIKFKDCQSSFLEKYL